jgi:glycosyltransferase involved in cell wall biosynthesis
LLAVDDEQRSPAARSGPADVAVVIPALDEERSIARVLGAIPRDRVREIVVVDNGSRDATAAVARASGAVVVREPRRGYGAACLAGLAHLRARAPAIVAFMDADGSDDPAQLPELLAPIRRGEADLVIGSRALGQREPGALTPAQEFGNHLAAFLLGFMFGARATDLGPFRAIRWESLERLRMRDTNYGWTVEMQARAARAGLRTAEVPVRYRRRAPDAGPSKISGTLRGATAAGWKILATLIRVRFGG